MKQMKFELGDAVIITNGPNGLVIARAEYLAGYHKYIVRYSAPDGRQFDHWYPEDALEPAEPDLPRLEG